MPFVIAFAVSDWYPKTTPIPPLPVPSPRGPTPWRTSLRAASTSSPGQKLRAARRMAIIRDPFNYVVLHFIPNLNNRLNLQHELNTRDATFLILARKQGNFFSSHRIKWWGVPSPTSHCPLSLSPWLTALGTRRGSHCPGKIFYASHIPYTTDWCFKIMITAI